MNLRMLSSSDRLIELMDAEISKKGLRSGPMEGALF